MASRGGNQDLMKRLEEEIKTSRAKAHQRGSQLLKARGTFGRKELQSQRAPSRREVRHLKKEVGISRDN